MIYTILTGISFVLLVYVCFSLLVNSDQPEKIGQKLFLSVTIPTMGVIFLATLYTVLEIYSISLMAISIAAVMVSLYLAAIRRKQLLSPVRFFRILRSLRFSKTALLIFLAAVVLYFGFPTTYLAGGRDPGLYMINAVRVSETGSYQVAHDEFLSENYESIKGFANLEYPGIYSQYKRGMSDDPGDRTAQFLPMFSAALAVGYDLFGMQGLLLTNAFISVLALFAVYYYVQSFSSRTVAIIASILLLVNPAQLWSARITQTEILSQLLVVLALWIFGVFYQKKSLPAAALAGALLGFSCINRIDMLVLGLGIYAIVAFCSLFQTGQTAYSLIAAGSYTIGAGLSVLYTYYFCYPYFEDLFKTKSLSGILLLNAAFALLMIFSLLLRLMILRKKTLREDVSSCPIYRKLVLALSVFLFLAFLFAYFIRPVISGAEFGTQDYFVSNAMAEFCFYTSFIAVPMAIIGMYRCLTNRKREVESLFLFFLTGLSSLVGYIYRPSIIFDHIWASRRWITVAIPFVIILCAYSIPELARGVNELRVRFRKGKRTAEISEADHIDDPKAHRRAFSKMEMAILISLTVIIAGFGLYQTRAFLFVKILDGIESDYKGLSEALDDNTVYYTKNDQIATVLYYVYGENVYMIRDNDKAVLEYVKKGEPFHYIGDPLLQNRLDMDFESLLLSEHQIEGTYLERAYNDYPDTTYQWLIPANVYSVVQTDSNQKILDLNSLALNNGVRDSSGISSAHTPGWVFFGPYNTIRNGSYEVVVNADLTSAVGEEIMVLDAVGDQGKTTFGEITVLQSDFSDDGKAEICFAIVIPETCVDFEIRCLSVDGAIFRVTQITLKTDE